MSAPPSGPPPIPPDPNAPKPPQPCVTLSPEDAALLKHDAQELVEDEKLLGMEVDPALDAIAKG